MNGAAVVAEILKREGTEFLSCYPRNQVIEPCAALGIRPILCRQERVGVGLADGYSRIKRGKVNGVFAAQAGPGIENAIIAIAITSWPPYARIARAETLTVRNSDYIAAVQLMGASPFRIVLRHIMPLCLSSLIVRVTLDMAGIIIIAAGLGFLGLGAQPPLPEWGAMIASGRRFILDQWWVAGMPGIAILVVSLGFNLLGDGLRDALDPRSGEQ